MHPVTDRQAASQHVFCELESCDDAMRPSDRFCGAIAWQPPVNKARAALARQYRLGHWHNSGAEFPGRSGKS
jgi:hypothetical protein